MMGALPLTSTTREGAPDSPVNLLFVGPEASIRRAIDGAKWTEGTASMTTSLLGALAHLARLQAPDVFPPVSPEYLFGRPQDAAFLRQLSFVRSRHHFRLWKAPFAGPSGEQVWAGTANLDASLVFLKRRFVHRIDPEIDRERDFILGTLSAGHEVLRAVEVARRESGLTGTDSNGYGYRTDGRILVLYFR
jgi:LssY-like putative type I secretion system component LssY